MVSSAIKVSIPIVVSNDIVVSKGRCCRSEALGSSWRLPGARVVPSGPNAALGGVHFHAHPASGVSSGVRPRNLPGLSPGPTEGQGSSPTCASGMLAHLLVVAIAPWGLRS